MIGDRQERKRTWPMVSALGLLLASCGDSGNANSAVAGACIAVCDKQATATGCTDLQSYLQTCRQVCPLVAATMTADCASKAQAQYDCQKEQVYKCGTGGNLPQPEDRQACQAEAQALAPCFQQHN